ncbi:ANKRD50, partial [Symbiodinium pilosum]
MQGGKLRPIDNYSSSLINDTVTVSEKPVTHSIDEIALLITKLSKSALKKGMKELFGKTADLKSAYRQLAISDESLKYSYLSVFDPVDKKPKAFRQLAVPFGSTKAVYFFLRVARALWTILVKGALIPTTNYFDDFVLLALSGDRSSCSHVFDEVMKLLGWKLSEDKSTDWSTTFEALGVLFEIDQTGSGVLKVRNTEKRREELTSLIKGFLGSGVMTQKEALQLR